MKAAVLFEPNTPLQIVECELDPPKALEVRVRMRASGVCQSDWHVMNGDWPTPMPVVPGHEADRRDSRMRSGPSPRSSRATM